MVFGVSLQAPIASGSQTIKGKIPVKEDSDSDFQPLIKSIFNCTPSSGPFEDFKKKSDIFRNNLRFLYMSKKINTNNTKQRKAPRQ
jgi:hypothetical protein